MAESTTLEYKASPAVDKSNKEEIAKDISAMANAEGGQFVYGMTEANNLPAGLDAGVNPKPYDGLWFEQVIQQNVTPKIEGLKILLIPLAGGNNAIVVTVPQSTTVHQVVKTGLYHRRRNFRNDIMPDYEIREAMNRNRMPDLYVDLFFPLKSRTHYADFSRSRDISMPVAFTPYIGNRSSTPALYTLVRIGFELGVVIKGIGDFHDGGDLLGDDGEKRRWMVRNTMVPHDMPIFKEMPRMLTQNNIIIAIPAAHMGQMSYHVRVEVQTPGFSMQEDWSMEYKGGNAITLRKVT